MALIWRLIVILFGFAVACAAAGAVVIVAVMYPEVSRLDLGPMDRSMVALLAAFGFIFISGFALLPALVIALVTEAFALRSILIYAVAGALAGLAAYLAFVPFDMATMQFTGIERRELEIMTGAGVVAGLVYWLIAGRNAGAWHRVLPSPQGRYTAPR